MRSYDNSRRRLAAEYRKLKQMLQVLGRREGRPRAQRRREARSAQIPESRICPVCGQPKPASRQWVLTDDRARCRSCWMRYEQ